MVESQPSKLLVAGPIPVSRSMFSTACTILKNTPLLYFRPEFPEVAKFRNSSSDNSSPFSGLRTLDSSLVTAPIF